MRAQRIGWVVVTVALAGLTIACSKSSTSPSTVSSVTVTGAAPAVGSAVQFTATAMLSDGTTQDVPAWPRGSPPTRQPRPSRQPAS